MIPYIFIAKGFPQITMMVNMEKRLNIYTQIYRILFDSIENLLRACARSTIHTFGLHCYFNIHWLDWEGTYGFCFP